MYDLSEIKNEASDRLASFLVLINLGKDCVTNVHGDVVEFSARVGVGME